MVVEFYDPVSKENISYYMDSRLKKNLDNIKEKLHKHDKDYVLIVDGFEGSGKSTIAMQIGKYVDNTLNLDRICMTAQEFKEAVMKADNFQCVIFDEAFTGLSSRSSLSEINRMLVSLMMQMRQKNLIVIVVLPSFFMLDKYVALFRARALVHIFEKGSRRNFMVYNRQKKKMLYLIGSKLYNYTKVGKSIRFKGTFFSKYVVDEEEYRKKKRTALEKVEFVEKYDKYKDQRNKLFNILSKEEGLTPTNIAKLCEKHKILLKRTSIITILDKFKEKPTEVSEVGVNL